MDASLNNLLQCKNKIRNSKEAYKKAKEKQTEGSPVFPTYTELRRCWDMRMSWKSQNPNKLELIIEKLKQTTNNESPTFDEEREDREIRENMRIMSISSCEQIILSAHFSSCEPFMCQFLFPHLFPISRQVPSFVTERYTTGIPV